MKIVHLCLSSFYIDDFGYQENLIPKYNKKDNHNITIVASRYTYNKQNGSPGLVEAGEYINNDGIKVIRIDYKYKWLGKLNDKLKIYKGTYEILEKEEPDLIFNHGIQFIDLLEVSRYVKNNPGCKLVVDNHAADINSATNFISRAILHKKIYKWVINKALPSISKIYNIAPGCRNFAVEMYNIPDYKMEYLYLGADTEKIDIGNREMIKQKVRTNLNIKEEDFVLITGGKLTKEKNTELLLKSIKKIQNKKLKVIIFGVFPDETKKEMIKLIESDNRVRYIGWLNSENVYDYFMASDVAVFPGTKSALWEQAVCTGLPLICRKWQGMDYVDVGGNCLFLEENIEEDLIKKIELTIRDKNLYNNMKQIAEEKGYKTFSYEKIARKAININ